MNLYIMRHGEAAPNAVDSERLLTAYGVESIERLAAYCAQGRLQCSSIWNSPLKRAEQTAVIMHEHLGLKLPREVVSDIQPGGDPDVVRALVEQQRQDLLLVSHLPFVDRLTSLLLSGRSRDMVHFRPGTIVALEAIAGQWFLSWCLHPKMI